MSKTEELYKLFSKHPNVCTDTRAIEKDCIFFALKGDNFNGNEYAAKAIEKGASYAVIDEERYQFTDQYILVPDVLKSLQSLARHHRNQFAHPVIGITGSNGKTTTKELLTAVLATQRKVHATSGNFNNHIGVPLTLLKQNSDHDLMIVEMGANMLDEIEMLCGISDPDIGLITNIGKAHLGGFGSFEGIIRTKLGLYRHIEAKGGIVFVNRDDELLMKSSKDITRKTYGRQKADYCADYHLNEKSCVVVDLEYENGVTKLETNLFGAYNFTNVLAAIAIGLYFNIKVENIQKALRDYVPSNNRSQILEKGSNTIVMDAYNANPSSMKLAVQSFNELPGAQKMLILGDMLELGEESQSEHQNIIKQVTGLNFSKVYLIGHEFGKTEHDFIHFQNIEEFSDFIKSNQPQNYKVLMKGSRSIGIEKSLEYFT